MITVQNNIKPRVKAITNYLTVIFSDFDHLGCLGLDEGVFCMQETKKDKPMAYLSQNLLIDFIA